MSKDILKNKLLKNFIKKYEKYYKGIEETENIRERVNSILLYLMENYMEKRTKSYLSMPSEKNYSNQKEVLFIRCKERKENCRYKRIKEIFSMNCEDIVYKAPNPFELKKELTNLFLYLGLENRMEVTIYDKKIDYDL
jgi:hypothetical protein